MIKINVESIPENEVKLLAMALLDGARKFYEDPKNVAAFEEWRKERAKKRA